jgi:Peptidase family M23
MKSLIALLPVLIAFQAGAPPALAWTWPAGGPVLRAFELEDDPYAAGQHRGIDVGGERGSPVLAPAGGVVSFAGTVPGGGRTVTVRTSDGYSVTLVHLGSTEVEAESAVGEGARVGTMGPSGEAEHPQPYVHLGIRVTSNPNGYLDPLSFLPNHEADPPPTPAPPGEAVPTVPAPAVPEAPAPSPETPALPAEAPAPAAETPITAPGVPAPAANEPVATGATPPRATTEHGPDALVVASDPSGRGGQTEQRQASASGAHGRAGGRLAGAGAVYSTSGLPSGSGPALRDAGESALGRAAETRSPTGQSGRVFDVAPIIGAAASLLALAATLALRRRQLVRAVPAHAPTPMLEDGARRAAEHAGASRPAQEDGLVLDRDLEGVALGEPEPLPDLDGDDDAAELVEVTNDACRRLPASVALPRFHRVRPRPSSSRCRRPELVSTR